MAFPIPDQACHTQEDLLLSLTDIEKHNQYEASLYMQSFFKTPTKLALIAPLSNHPLLIDSSESQEIKDDLDDIVRTMQHLYFEDPKIKEKVNEISQAIQIGSTYIDLPVDKEVKARRVGPNS